MGSNLREPRQSHHSYFIQQTRSVESDTEQLSGGQNHEFHDPTRPPLSPAGGFAVLYPSLSTMPQQVSGRATKALYCPACPIAQDTL